MRILVLGSGLMGPAAAFNAAAAYASYCASCHGASRQGGSGPALTATALALGLAKASYQVAAVASRSMPSAQALRASGAPASPSASAPAARRPDA